MSKNSRTGRERRRVLNSGGAWRASAVLASSAALVAIPAVAVAKTPTHPFVPGSVVISETSYPQQGIPLKVGDTLPEGASAVADGAYPGVFNNDAVDDFAVQTPFDLIDADSAGNQLLQVRVPTDRVTTSFSSKSEGAINFSTSGQDLSFLGYQAPLDALDVSNSNTPGDFDSTNPDPGSYYRVAGDLDATGNWTFTDTNAYTGDNGRAVALNNASDLFYAAGNSNNGKTTDTPIINAGGAQVFSRSTLPQSQQSPSSPTPLGSFSIASLGDKPDKAGKDTNFRGLTVYNNVVYETKGSGSNGVNTVYFVDTSPDHSACPNGVGLPVPGASLPTQAGSPYPMCILSGFNTTIARTTTDSFPFGMWFANADTLYVADEGSGSNTYDPSTKTYTDAASQTLAGLQKWVFDTTTQTWKLAYTIRTGLGLGRPYTVPAYPSGNNSQTGLPWAPATDGLRNISGHLNGDGTATIYAATSTVSGGGDQGADPNEVVAVTDELAAPSAGLERFRVIRAPRARYIYRGVAVVPHNYGSGS
jgi:hypothetical protein